MLLHDGNLEHMAYMMYRYAQHNQCRCFCKAHTPAYASFSIVAQLTCVGVNLLLANATGLYLTCDVTLN